MSAEQIITDNLDIWTSAIKTKSAAGRGSSNKLELYGIKKLRELILELAVRGLLVPQDSNDEPASVLLERVAVEKEKLIKEGKIKKQKALPLLSDNETPFSLPKGWGWVRLDDVASVIRGITYKKGDISDSQLENTVALMRANNIGRELNFEKLIYVPESIVKPEQLILKGDLLIAMSSGSANLVGKAAQANEDLGNTYGAFCAVIRSYSTLLISYFGLYFKTPLYRKQTQEIGKGIGIQNLNQGALRSLLIPIPSVEAMKGIVAKVDDLMALCDQLEQQQESSLRAHQTLVDTLLDCLVNAKGAIVEAGKSSEFHEAWTRIADNFDTLFTTESSIDKLKQTILQLAVMGKLVPQDPNDEPANELLKKIAAEKSQLVKDGKIKKPKVFPSIEDDEKLFSIPAGWEWCKFGDLAQFINGDRSKSYPNKSEYVESGVPWINTGHIEPDGTLSAIDMNFITREKFESLGSGKIEQNDLVYCLRGATFGKTAFATPYKEGAIASSLMIIRLYLSQLGEYVYRYLISPFGKRQLLRFDNGSAQPNLSANSVTLYAFPVPPLKEQTRIVSKVNELMALCDTLKANLKIAQTTQLQLADAMAERAAA